MWQKWVCVVGVLDDHSPFSNESSLFRITWYSSKPKQREKRTTTENQQTEKFSSTACTTRNDKHRAQRKCPIMPTLRRKKYFIDQNFALLQPWQQSFPPTERERHSGYTVGSTTISCQAWRRPHFIPDTLAGMAVTMLHGRYLFTCEKNKETAPYWQFGELFPPPLKFSSPVFPLPTLLMRSSWWARCARQWMQE